MSFEAMAWAVKQKTANAGQKLVLLLLANHANGVTGQCNPSHRRLAESCEMGASTLRKHIAELEKHGFLIIVPKFVDGVQLPNQYNLNLDGCSNQADGMLNTSIGVCSNRAPNKQEDKTVIKPVDQKNNYFDEFWKAYPRKTNKGFARKVFEKLKVDDAMLTKMLQAIYVQNKNVWKDKDQQYIPHPSTWLNGERWDDEVVVKPMSASDREKARIFG
jgi:DNA-binding transcriptional regulator YhcF (GntR family)